MPSPTCAKSCASSPGSPHLPRLSDEDLPHARALLVDCGVNPCSESGDAKLRELQRMYEPFLAGLSQLLCMSLPSWGVGADFARLPRSKVWARITSETVEDSSRPFHHDEGRHL